MWIGAIGLIVATVVKADEPVNKVREIVKSNQSTAEARTLRLGNDAVVRELAFDGHVWRTTKFCRADGSDELKVKSDEFHILFLDDKEVTLDQYQVDGEPVQDGDRRISIRYVPRSDATLPGVTITYSIGKEPYPRKTVSLRMKQGEMIDRLEVERFSVDVPATRGGRGEPVFVNYRWWFGVEYPAFYSRRTDGNTPEWEGGPYDRMATYPSRIFLDGRDREKQPRAGLIRFMHFPGAARKLADGSWGIVGKTAVCGVRDPKQTMELSFLDYFATICKPVRSFVHYNNWYDPVGRNLSISNFVSQTYIPMRDALAPYGVKLDAMVPDDGWQDRSSIYEPEKKQFPKGWDDLARLSGALGKEGTRLGIWLALGGYGLNMQWGREHGFKEAARNTCFSGYQRAYSLADPKYNAAIREVLVRLLHDCRLNYFKHDFNEMCDTQSAGQPQTDRHGHEAEVDATLGLLALEREINPDVFQNMTNWIWFSPWWLQACDTIWMLAGDDGLINHRPEISMLARASLYRDAHLYRAWGLGENRPLVPVSQLMTHGIIYTTKLYGHSPDSVREFTDYVMMYYVRGLKLKEWYFSPGIMNSNHWRAVGTITRWANENQGTLANAVLVGGSPEKYEPYGYVSWAGAKGILAVRNTRRGPAEIVVPFDQSVWYRGEAGRKFHANVIYPYQAAWPAVFQSGEAMKLTVPGDTLLVMNLEPNAGQAISSDIRLSEVTWSNGFLTLPEEAMQLCELLVSEQVKVTLDGQTLKSSRTSSGRGVGRSAVGWGLAAYDLQSCRGKTVRLAFACEATPKMNPAFLEGWLVMDRPVSDKPVDNDLRLPWAIAHGYRRQTVCLFDHLTWDKMGAH